MIHRIEVTAAPHLEFFAQRVVEDSEGFVVKMDLYNAYVEWSKSRGNHPCAHERFSNLVKMQYSHVNTVQSRAHGRQRAWRGIRMVDCSDNPESQNDPYMRKVYDILVVQPRKARNEIFH